MTKSIFFTFFVLMFGSLSAQKLQLDWKESMAGKNSNFTIKGEYNGELFVLAEYMTVFTYFKYDSKTLKPLAELKIELPKMNSKPVDIRTIFMFKGEMIVLADNEVKKDYKLYAFVIDRTGKMKPNPKVMFQANTEKLVPNGSLWINTSTDMSRLSILQNYTVKEEGNSVLRVKIFDENFEEVSDLEKRFSGSEKDINYRLVSSAVDNNGDVIWLLTKYNTKTKDSSFRLIYSLSNKQTLEHDISLKEFLRKKGLEKEGTTSAIVNVSPEGDICITGFYDSPVETKSPYKNALQGVFHVRVDRAKDEVGSMDIMPFDEKCTNDLTRQWNSRLQVGVQFTLTPKRFIFKEDGGAFLFSEQFEIHGSGEGASGYYGTILITSIDKTGKIEWMQTVFKHQVGVINAWNSMLAKATRYSFLSGVKDGKPFVIFNDNPKNAETGSLKDRESKTTQLQTANVPVMMMFEEDGKLHKMDVVKTENGKNAYISPFVATVLNDSEFIVYGDDGKTYRFCHVSIK